MPIVFRPGRTTAGDWSGLVVPGAAALRHAVVEYAAVGVGASTTAPPRSIEFRDSFVRHSSGIGVSAPATRSPGTTLTVERTVLSDNVGAGISCESSSGPPLHLTLSSNEVFGCSHWIVSYNFNPDSTVRTVGNSVHDLPGYGIHLGAGLNGRFRSTVVDGNSITRADHGVSLSLYYNAGHGPISVTGNVVDDCGTGIYCLAKGATLTYGPLTIATNSMTGSWQGLYLDVMGTAALPTITGNTITGNEQYGVTVYGNALHAFAGNSIFDNGTYDIVNATAAAQNAQGVWWGAATTNEMAANPYPSNISKIRDSFDGPIVGTVDYANWVTLAALPS